MASVVNARCLYRSFLSNELREAWLVEMMLRMLTNRVLCTWTLVEHFGWTQSCGQE
jgi:hypothetical protein